MLEQRGSEHRDIRQHRDHGDVGRLEARIGTGELEVMQQCGEPLAGQRDADADDDLVQSEAYAEQHHDDGHRHAGEASRQEAQPQRAAEIGAEEASICAADHHALDANVKHTRLLRHLLAKPCEQ